MDPRHPHHGNLHFTGCGDDGCGIHQQGKDDADYYPRPMVKCRVGQWNKYTDNACPIHLIDKRYHQYFPGKPYFRANHQRKLMRQEAQVTNCKQTPWQSCIVDGCEIHYKRKRYKGFHQDDLYYSHQKHLLEKQENY